MFLGFYIHIPFCVRKCFYCDFVSYAGKEYLIHAYFEALRREWEWYLHQGLLAAYTPSTLYVGGGTPSLATEELVSNAKMIFCAPDEQFQEATIEVNPGAISFGQLQQLRQAGFNRVSIGVQSLANEELTTLGRFHSRNEAIACFDAARRAGFQNISLDLIFGIPGSTLDMWESTLRKAIAFHPEHISTYNLTIEPGTPFWRQQQQGMLALPDEDLQLTMYQTAITMLTRAGYEHYEISNFALPEYRCLHNQIYWRNEEYLGLGAGAYSYLQGCRYWNEADLETYIRSIVGHTSRLTKVVANGTCAVRNANGTCAVHNPGTPATVAGSERLDLPGVMGETVIMNLRMLEGLNMPAFQQRFGQAVEAVFAKSLDKLVALGLLECSGTYLRLTPKGLYLSNEVFQEFLST